MELDTDSKSEVISEVENRNDDKSVVSSKDSVANGETAETMIDSKISVSDESKLTSKENTDKIILPKRIVELESLNVAEFIKLVETECDSHFIIAAAGRWVKITTDSFSTNSNFVL